MRLAAVSLMAAGVASFSPAASASDAADSAREGEVLAVLDFRSHLRGEAGKKADAASLGERVRFAASRALPQAQVIPRDELVALLPTLFPASSCDGSCAVQAARDVGADLVVSGELRQGRDGYLLALELREADGGTTISSSVARGGTLEELGESCEGASADLFRPLRSAPAAAVVAIGPVALPDVPAPAGAVREGGAVDLDVDAHVLVAYDHARTVETAGRERPDEAAAAWDAVAKEPGKNPFRELSAARAARWTSYAEGKRAFEAQYSKDRSRLRKVLPLKWVADQVKLELLTRYAQTYGAPKAAALLPLLKPATARERARLVVGCEGKESAPCTALARASDAAKDRPMAAEYLGRACSAGSMEACAEAGDRFLQTGTRDVARALGALERACAARRGSACARLARVYEDADGARPDAALAVQLREQACSAGDGRSCRRLASAVEGDSPGQDLTRAKELWAKGCAAGDGPSCVLAGRSEVRETLAAPAKMQVAAAPAQAVDQPAFRRQPMDAPPAADAKADRKKQLGLVLFGVSAVTVGGLALVALEPGDGANGRFRRNALTAPAHSSGTSARTGAIYALSAAAALSAGVGAVLFFSKPEPSKPQVNVSVGPGALLLSGTLP